jgi:hypothetical protein
VPQERKQILTSFSSIIAAAEQPGQIRDFFVSQDEIDIKAIL